MLAEFKRFCQIQNPKVTHASINQAWRKVTSLIKTNELPLHQTTSQEAESSHKV